MSDSDRPEACYSERLDRALSFAASGFRHRVRKGTGVPYLTHLLGVMVLVAEHGGDEEQMIAALLHDYLEDIEGSSVETLEREFGERVAHYVLAMSDTTVRPKPPWQERKRRHIAQMATEPPELKLVSAADKLHNARSLLREHAEIGDSLWGRFNASRDQTLWYYREVVRALGQGWQHPICDELSAVVRALHQSADVEYGSP